MVLLVVCLDDVLIASDEYPAKFFKLIYYSCPLNLIYVIPLLYCIHKASLEL